MQNLERRISALEGAKLKGFEHMTDSELEARLASLLARIATANAGAPEDELDQRIAALQAETTTKRDCHAKS